MGDWPFGSLRPFFYQVGLIDVPWRYTMRSPKGYARSPESQYRTMPDEEVLRLPVAHLFRGNALIVMWSVWPRLDFAMEVLNAWGFTYRTGGAWRKTTKYGKTCFGTGYILRSACEPFLVGTLGRPKYASRSERNLVEGLRREHSRKPPEMRRMIERLMPSAYGCELFAREPWPGYDIWGDETDKFREAA